MKKFVCLFEDFSKKYFSKKIILLLGLIPRTYFKINKLISDYKLSEIYSPIYQKIEYGGKFFYILLDKTNGGVDRDILLNGVYEADIMKILDENLKVGMNFVDIGSNIGYHSLFVSKIIGPKGKIFSFEPIKRVYNQFEKSISKNKFKNIYAYNFAIGTRNKISKIYINENNVGGSSLINKTKTFESIKTKTPDKLLSDHKIDFIKIDVEGYEYYVLKSLEKIITADLPNMLIEYSPIFYDKINIDMKKNLIKLLKKWNYVLFDVDADKLISDSEKFVVNFKRNQTNLFCMIEPREKQK